MGFEPQETLYKLTFEDPDMAGLEVTIREPSIDGLLSLGAIAGLDTKTVDAAKIRPVFEAFASLLESWNVERKGKPVPATYEGIVSQTPGFIFKIIAATDKAVAGVDPTSLPGSGGGGTPDPVEASIPMTASPPS